MHELCSLGSERGAISNARPYRNPQVWEFGWPSGTRILYDPELAAMTPDQLRTFAVVAAHRNISSAAQELHLSQPAVSGQLRLLAESFGEPLYHRCGRGINLTPAGEQLAEFARRVRLAYDQALALRDTRGSRGSVLRIGASTTPASYLLPHLVVRFQEQFPAVRVSMIRSGNSADIVSRLGTLDMGFIEGQVPLGLPVGTQVIPWRTDQVVAIASTRHPLAQVGRAARALSLRELAQHPLIWREFGSGLRMLVEAVFAAHGISPTTVLEVTSVEGVKEAVRADMGIGFVSELATRDEPGFVTLPLSGAAQFRRQFSILTTPHGLASQACRAFFAVANASD